MQEELPKVEGILAGWVKADQGTGAAVTKLEFKGSKALIFYRTLLIDLTEKFLKIQ